MRARGMQFGPLTLPTLEAQYAFALKCTMQTYSLKSDFVDKRSQDTMLNTLFIQCVQNVKVYFQACPEYYNPETDVEKWPWWTSQNDSLRKIVFGNYRGSTLPVPFVNAIRRIPDDKYRSFFVQRCIVYHNALYARKAPKMNQKGVIEIGQDAPSLTEEDFARIDVTIPVDLLPMHDPVSAPAAPTESSLDVVANEHPPPPPLEPSPVQVQHASSELQADPSADARKKRNRNRQPAEAGGTSRIPPPPPPKKKKIKCKPPQQPGTDSNGGARRGARR
jgi:hypothetical protein